MITHPTWFTGLLNKYPLPAIQILLLLLDVGRKYGRVSPNDIPDEIVATLDQPCIIGCVFRLLRRFGFEATGGYIKSTTTRHNRSGVKVWVLVNPVPMRELRDAVYRHILDNPAPLPRQMELL